MKKIIAAQSTPTSPDVFVPRVRSRFHRPEGIKGGKLAHHLRNISFHSDFIAAITLPSLVPPQQLPGYVNWTVGENGATRLLVEKVDPEKPSEYLIPDSTYVIVRGYFGKDDLFFVAARMSDSQVKILKLTVSENFYEISDGKEKPLKCTDGPNLKKNLRKVFGGQPLGLSALNPQKTARLAAIYKFDQADPFAHAPAKPSGNEIQQQVEDAQEMFPGLSILPTPRAGKLDSDMIRLAVQANQSDQGDAVTPANVRIAAAQETKRGSAVLEVKLGHQLAQKADDVHRWKGFVESQKTSDLRNYLQAAASPGLYAIRPSQSQANVFVFVQTNPKSDINETSFYVRGNALYIMMGERPDPAADIALEGASESTLLAFLRGKFFPLVFEPLSVARPEDGFQRINADAQKAANPKIAALRTALFAHYDFAGPDSPKTFYDLTKKAPFRAVLFRTDCAEEVYTLAMGRTRQNGGMVAPMMERHFAITDQGFCFLDVPMLAGKCFAAPTQVVLAFCEMQRLYQNTGFFQFSSDARKKDFLGAVRPAKGPGKGPYFFEVKSVLSAAAIGTTEKGDKEIAFELLAGEGFRFVGEQALFEKFEYFADALRTRFAQSAKPEKAPVSKLAISLMESPHFDPKIKSLAELSKEVCERKESTLLFCQKGETEFFFGAINLGAVAESKNQPVCGVFKFWAGKNNFKIDTKALVLSQPHLRQIGFLSDTFTDLDTLVATAQQSRIKKEEEPENSSGSDAENPAENEPSEAEQIAELEQQMFTRHAQAIESHPAYRANLDSIDRIGKARKDFEHESNPADRIFKTSANPPVYMVMMRRENKPIYVEISIDPIAGFHATGDFSPEIAPNEKFLELFEALKNIKPKGK